MAENQNLSTNDEFNQFLVGYLNRGFGSMNKNDFEVWIFNHLLSNKFPDSSDYEISVELKIPETKVKRLRYEAELKYSDVNEERCKEQLAKKIRKAHFNDTKTGQIEFSIESKMLRSYLSSVLTQDGRFYDSSFNQSMIRLSVSDFLYLIQKVYFDDEWKQIVQQAKQDLNEPKELPKTLVEALGDAGKQFAENLLKNLIGEGAAFGITKCTKQVFDEFLNFKSK